MPLKMYFVAILCRRPGQIGMETFQRPAESRDEAIGWAVQQFLAAENNRGSEIAMIHTQEVSLIPKE